MSQKKTKDPLGNRMKGYESLTSHKLMKGCPTILRLDGKAFHTLLKGAQRPFDNTVIDAMNFAAQAVMSEIGGSARFAYIQSDECSIVINDSMKLSSEPWFGNKIQKIVSVAASIMSVNFSSYYGRQAYFDARVFQVPNITEMHNAILWRQFDASKNSITMYASKYYSHKKLQGKSGSDKQDMMFTDHGFNWNDAPTWTKRGVIVTRESIDWGIPKFNEDPSYLSNLYNPVVCDDSQGDDNA